LTASQRSEWPAGDESISLERRAHHLAPPPPLSCLVRRPRPPSPPVRRRLSDDLSPLRAHRLDQRPAPDQLHQDRAVRQRRGLLSGASARPSLSAGPSCCRLAAFDPGPADQELDGDRARELADPLLTCALTGSRHAHDRSSTRYSVRKVARLLSLRARAQRVRTLVEEGLPTA
jgi:hypothetical protein